MASSGYFSILEKNPNFGEMKPTCGLPITKFASSLCLKPTYKSQGNITVVFLFVNKHDSYWLDILLWCDEDLGYFYDLCQVVDFFSILENFPCFREMKPTCRLPTTKFTSTLCLKPTYISQGNITVVFLSNNKSFSY